VSAVLQQRHQLLVDLTGRVSLPELLGSELDELVVGALAQCCKISWLEQVNEREIQH